jgi:lipoprotein NlpI
MRSPLLRTAFLGASLFLLSGCVLASPESIDVTDTLSGTALVMSSWHPGTGVLVDRDEQFFVTSCQIISGREEVEVVFPIIENGKSTTNREEWEAKGRRIRGRVVCTDVGRDLAVLRLDFLPDNAQAVRLATGSPAKDAPVQFLGAAKRVTSVWEPASASVADVDVKLFTFDSKQKRNLRRIELNVEGELAKSVAGGPLLNQSNEIVGIIASETVQTEQLQCIDISEVRAVVSLAFRRTAMLSFDKGDYDKAIHLCNRALALNPSDALNWNERGAAYSMKDLFEKAIADYSRAVTLDPQLALAYRNRGSSYYHSGNYRKAIEDCNKALALVPSYPMAYHTRRLAYTKLGKTALASEDSKIIAALERSVEWRLVSPGERTDAYRRNAPAIGSPGGC